MLANFVVSDGPPDDMADSEETLYAIVAKALINSKMIDITIEHAYSISATPFCNSRTIEQPEYGCSELLLASSCYASERLHKRLLTLHIY